MAQRVSKKNRFLIARTVHPEYLAVVSTYARNLGIHIETFGYQDNGRVDLADLSKRLKSDVAAVVIQSPNFFGTIEQTHDISELAHQHGALAIVTVAEAVSMGILKPPGADKDEKRTADIVLGEGQSLGVPMSFGGPNVGFLATHERFMRQIPGRLVGIGQDFSGRRAFVLTLSTREQHIRREKATSNICTNQSLCALMATIYLSTVGPKGLREICEHNILKTGYAVRQVGAKTAHDILFNAPRFNEFVIKLKDDYAHRAQKMLQNRIVPGLRLSRFYPELGNTMLVCVTETSSRAQIDAFVKELE